jgi:hypothetical protein
VSEWCRKSVGTCRKDVGKASERVGKMSESNQGAVPASMDELGELQGALRSQSLWENAAATEQAELRATDSRNAGAFKLGACVVGLQRDLGS